jgi:hypothetical protein
VQAVSFPRVRASMWRRATPLDFAQFLSGCIRTAEGQRCVTDDWSTRVRRGGADTSAHHVRPGRSGRCVAQTLSIQHVDELHDAVSRRKRLCLLRAVASKAALFEDADRPRVVRRDVGIHSARRHLIQKLGQRLRGDAKTPKFAPDSVANNLPAVLRPAVDVTRHQPINNYGARNQGVTATESRPMRSKLTPVASRTCRDVDRLRIRLVIEERLKVSVFDVPEIHCGSRFVDFQSPLDRNLASIMLAGGLRPTLAGTGHIDGPPSIDHTLCFRGLPDLRHIPAIDTSRRSCPGRVSALDGAGSGWSLRIFLRTICGPLAPCNALTCANAPIQTLKRNSTTSPSAMT